MTALQLISVNAVRFSLNAPGHLCYVLQNRYRKSKSSKLPFAAMLWSNSSCQGPCLFARFTGFSTERVNLKYLFLVSLDIPEDTHLSAAAPQCLVPNSKTPGGCRCNTACTEHQSHGKLFADTKALLPQTIGCYLYLMGVAQFGTLDDVQRAHHLLHKEQRTFFTHFLRKPTFITDAGNLLTRSN